MPSTNLIFSTNIVNSLLLFLPDGRPEPLRTAHASCDGGASDQGAIIFFYVLRQFRPPFSTPFSVRFFRSSLIVPMSSVYCLISLFLSSSQFRRIKQFIKSANIRFVICFGPMDACRSCLLISDFSKCVTRQFSMNPEY